MRDNLREMDNSLYGKVYESFIYEFYTKATTVLNHGNWTLKHLKIYAISVLVP